MLRSVFLLALLSGLAWWLHGEQERGQFREVDNHFLNFLLANSREQLQPDPAKLGEVIFLRLREEDKAEYTAWPPLPIDYQMIIKGLAPYEPATLVIAEPLQWPAPKPEFIDSLAESLLPLPAVVMAVGADSQGKADLETVTWAKDHLPAVQVEGEVTLLPELAQLNLRPEAALLHQNDLGCLVPGKATMALRADDRVLPSLEWLALAHATRTPLQRQRLQLGPGAGLHVGDALFVPLELNGGMPAAAMAVPSANALDLMTAKLTDEEVTLAKTLGKGKTLVLGIDNDDPNRPTAARRVAQSLAFALALPRLRELTQVEQWGVWGLAGLLGLSLLRLPKRKGLTRSLLYLFFALAGSYLAFQATKVWCPPTIPAALIAVSGLFVRLFGKRSIIAPPAGPAEPVVTDASGPVPQ